MKKRFLSILLALVLAFALAIPSLAREADQGLEVMSMLSTEQYEGLFEQSNEPMRQALTSAEGYRAVWQGLLLQYGKYEGAESKGVQAIGGYTVHQVSARFERALIVFGVSFDREEGLAGLQILEVQPVEEAKEDAGQRLLLRPGAPDETEAFLVMPEGSGPFPVVILIQGSGPNDKDESDYGMAPFRDLAEGFSMRGIATLRYDKYTLAHRGLLMSDKALMASFTMKEEYVNDALAAWELLSGDERFSGVFLLGHSQGAYAVPRVAAELPEGALNGMILLAGSPLSLTALIDRQSRDQLAGANLTPEQFSAAEAQLNAEQERLMIIEQMGEEELKETLFYGSLSGWYLADEHAWAPVPLLMGMDLPLLVVQGGKDWQVKPEEGIQLWQKMLVMPGEQAALPDGSEDPGKLITRPETDYLLYPDMTHLLFDLPGPSSGGAADYLEPYPASEVLLDDLADWIKVR